MKVVARRGLALALSSCVAAAALSACARGDEETSSGTDPMANCPADAREAISGDTLKFATSGPLSGPVAILGDLNRAAKAYFDYANKSGGIDTVDGKKKVEVELLDDQYTTNKAQSNVRKAVEADKAVGIVVQAGSAMSEAAADYLNRKCVPQLFSVSGSQAMLSEERPFTTLASTYYGQARVIGRQILDTDPDATVAVLYSNDDTGISTLQAVKDELEGSDVKVIAEESYEPSTTSIKPQMTSLAASEADIMVNSSSGVVCTQVYEARASSQWQPRLYQTNVCNEASIKLATASAANDAFSTIYTQAPTAETPEIEQFRTVMEAAGLEANSTTMIGYLNAQLAAQAISNAETLSRVDIAKAALELNADDIENSVLIQGIEFQDGAGLPLLSNYSVAEFSDGAFRSDGTLLSASKTTIDD